MTSHPFDLLPLPNGANFIFTPCPGTKDAGLTDAINDIKQAGASAIVTMLSTEEMTKLGVPNLGQEIKDADMAWFQLPVVDDCEPEQDFEAGFAKARETLLALIQSKATIAIHCRGGSGRTGLMAAILLLESGQKWQDIAPLIQSIRPKALTLDPHLSFLKKHYTIDA